MFEKVKNIKLLLIMPFDTIIINKIFLLYFYF